MNNWLILVCLIITFFTKANSNLCFGCRDTSSTDGKNDCQKKSLYPMYELHKEFLTTHGNNTNDFLKKHGEDVLVQDCSVYPDHKYCCIEEFEKFGSIYSYIRGCCNGKNFSVSVSNVPKLKFAYPNNQTLCAYDDLSGYTICVTVCTGMFCNGPSFAESIHVFSIAVLIFCHVFWRIFAT